MFRAFSTHYPVMWRDVLKIFEQQFTIEQPLLIADCTLGLGGHSLCLLETFPNAYIVSADLDPDAIKVSKENLKGFEQRISINHTNYTQLFKFPRFPEIFKAKKNLMELLWILE